MLSNIHSYQRKHQFSASQFIIYNLYDVCFVCFIHTVEYTCLSSLISINFNEHFFESVGNTRINEISCNRVIDLIKLSSIRNKKKYCFYSWKFYKSSFMLRFWFYFHENNKQTKWSIAIFFGERKKKKMLVSQRHLGYNHAGGKSFVILKWTFGDIPFEFHFADVYFDFSRKR